MKILIAAGIWPPDPGGPAIHASKQSEYFKSQGFQVNVAALAHFRKWPAGVRHILYFCTLIKKGIGKDSIYAHDALGVGWPAYIAARLLRKKVLVRIGGDIPWEREAESGKTNHSLKEWYQKGLHRKSNAFRLSNIILKHFDAVIVPTQLLVDLYHRYYHVPLAKLHLIPNPIPLRQDVNVPTEGTIIYASRLVAYKNLEFVIHSLTNVFAKYPDVTFTIMGDGPERSSLQKQIQEERLENRVRLKGKVPQEEVMKETQSCLLGLAPALTEFNPNYILQCIAYSKPFLISRENGLPFVVPDIFLFNPRDSREFQSKLEYLLSVEGYQKSVEAIRDLGFSMSWEDNLVQNLKILGSLL